MTPAWKEADEKDQSEDRDNTQVQQEVSWFGDPGFYLYVAEWSIKVTIILLKH